jgi:hypothetical protein
MVPETKDLPTVFSAKIHIDHGNDALVVDKGGGLEPNDKEHGRVSATKVKAEKIEYMEG